MLLYIPILIFRYFVISHSHISYMIVFQALDPTATDNKAPTEADINNVCTPDSTGVVRKNVKNMKMDNVNVLTSTPPKDMPGHTGYLTFASLYPMFTGGA